MLEATKENQMAFEDASRIRSLPLAVLQYRALCLFQLAALFSAAAVAPTFSADTFACMNSKR